MCEFYHDFVGHLTTGYVTLKVLPIIPTTNKRIRSYGIWELRFFFADRFILRCCLGIMYVSLKGSNLLVLT